MNQPMPVIRLKKNDERLVSEQMAWIYMALVNMRKDDVLKEIELNYPEVFNYE